MSCKETLADLETICEGDTGKRDNTYANNSGKNFTDDTETNGDWKT